MSWQKIQQQNAHLPRSISFLANVYQDKKKQHNTARSAENFSELWLISANWLKTS